MSVPLAPISMRADVFVYISGPMSPCARYTIEENLAVGVRCYFDLLRRGIPAFCPHLSGFPPSAWSALHYDTWLAYDYAVIDRCTHLLLLPRAMESRGAVAEQMYAKQRGIPVVLSIEELLQHIGMELEATT